MAGEVKLGRFSTDGMEQQELLRRLTDLEREIRTELDQLRDLIASRPTREELIPSVFK